MQTLEEFNPKFKYRELGLGIEHFVRNRNKEFLRNILDEAYNLGITHFDIVYNYPHFFDVFKEFIKYYNNEISFTLHIGQVYNENKDISQKSRSLTAIKSNVEYVYNVLDLDYIDTGILQYITSSDDWKVIKEKRILKYGNDLKDTGKLKSFGISSHRPELLLEIIKDNEFDVIMFPINFVTGHLQGTKELINECKSQSIKIMGIKTLLHGKPFTTKKIKYPKLMSCFSEHSVKLESPAKPYQCFNYALDQGVDQIIFGIKNIYQLQENVESYKTNKEMKDYSKIEKQFIEGEIG